MNRLNLTRLRLQLEATLLILDRDPRCGCGCPDLATHAYRVARNAAGPLKSAGGGSHGKGDHADPVTGVFREGDPRRGYVDESMGWLDEYTASGLALSDAVSRHVSVVHRLGIITSSDPRELARTGQGTCPACGDFCSGAANDRLRSGFCAACYQAWTRAGRTDRQVFIRERKRDGAA